MNVLMFLI